MRGFVRVFLLKGMSLLILDRAFLRGFVASDAESRSWVAIVVNCFNMKTGLHFSKSLSITQPKHIDLKLGARKMEIKLYNQAFNGNHKVVTGG